MRHVLLPSPSSSPSAARAHPEQTPAPAGDRRGASAGGTDAPPTTGGDKFTVEGDCDDADATRHRPDGGARRDRAALGAASQPHGGGAIVCADVLPMGDTDEGGPTRRTGLLQARVLPRLRPLWGERGHVLGTGTPPDGRFQMAVDR